MRVHSTDVLVIGAGASGLAAAIKLSGMGYDVSVVEREPAVGVILNQCIHNGFGLHYFKEELTGPEFAGRLADIVPDAIDIVCNATVDRLLEDKDGLGAVVFSSGRGITRYKCKAIVIALGWRDRKRGNIRMPVSMPSGIFSAGRTRGYRCSP